MRISIFFKRLFDRKIKFRGRDFLYYEYNCNSFRIGIEHLINEQSDLVIYKDTLKVKKDSYIDYINDDKEIVLESIYNKLEELGYSFELA